MKGLTTGLFTIAVWLAVLASPATAMCDLPAELRNSAPAAARYLLEHAEFVGIVEVVSAGREGDDVPETLEVLLPFKGDYGRIDLRRARQGSAIVVTNASVTLGLPAGSIGLAALHRTSDGLVVSECTSALYLYHRPATLLRELGRMRTSSSH